MEPVRKDMDQKAADELGRGQLHHLLALSIFDAIVFPSERDRGGIGADDAAVRDGDTVRVMAEVGQHSRGATEGWFGINHPSDLRKGASQLVKVSRFARRVRSPKKASSPARCNASSPSMNRRLKNRDRTRTCKKNPGLHATQRVPLGDRPPPGTIMWT